MPEKTVRIPEAAIPVFSKKYRYRGMYGGRGSAKTGTCGRMALSRGIAEPLNICCAREYQNSIDESVYKVLCDLINKYPIFKQSYIIQKRKIYSKPFADGRRTEIFFRGLHSNPDSIKGIENVDICWIEEAENVAEYTYRKLIPTVRKKGSEIWLTWNPESSDSATYKRFIETQPINSIIKKLNYEDNEWFDETELENERLDDLKRDPDMYDHIWNGNVITRSDAQIFKDKWKVRDFVRDPSWDGPYFGVDWGFVDNFSVIRFSIDSNNNLLYIESEAGGSGIKIDDLASYVEKVPESTKHQIYADAARPDLITHLKDKNFNIQAAKKWPDSIVAGINWLKSFDKIIIHPDCVRTQEEFRRYSYKVDRLSGDVMDVIVDKWNHFVDAIRYAGFKMILQKVEPNAGPMNMTGLTQQNDFGDF